MRHILVQPELLCAWHGESLLIVNTRGDCDSDQPLAGYYFRETRFLRTLRLTINGEAPWLCEAAAADPRRLSFAYVHPELRNFGGGGSGDSGDEVRSDPNGIPYRTLDVRAQYEVALAELRVLVRVTNRARRTLSFTVGWQLDADYADIQEALAQARQQSAAVAREADGSRLRLHYEHAQLPYETSIHAHGDGHVCVTADGVVARLTLASQESATLALTVHARDFEDALGEQEAARRERHWQSWRDALAGVRTPVNPIAEAILQRNVGDYASFPLLQGAPDEWLAMQAGVPLYPALFGRDTITAGWQAAFLDRGAALDASLTRLGRLQGERLDERRDEEPGRIPFQLRRGPLARLEINPYGRYYADYASPLMFVIALAHLYAWTGEKAILERHWDRSRRILDWAREYGDRDSDGYLEYQTRSAAGPKNQGWKDSGDALVYEDGTAVPAPIATCELQGYWFAAQQLMAVLSWVLGARDDARAQWREAMELKLRFNRDWWMPDENFFAIAMDPDKRLVRALTSNVGHCIATGIVDDDHLPATVGRLFAPDLFSGWGIRTLSTAHVSYNPISYHLGSVWAVEQATIAFGLRRFGFDSRAQELAQALFDLAALYPDYRVPECIGGYSRAEWPTPGAYPRANPAQLWNASAFPLLVHSLLGLQPVAPLDVLVVDPVLPSWLCEVVLHRMRVGAAEATIRFWRGENGESHAEVLHQRGTLHLLKQPPLESLASGIRDRLGAFVDGVWHR